MKKLIAIFTLAAFSAQAMAGTKVTTIPLTAVDTVARKDIADMKKQLATLTGTVTTLASTVQAQTQTINNLAAAVTTLRGQTAQLSQQVTDLAAAVAGMKKNLATEAQLAVLATGVQDKVKTGTRNTAPAVYPQLPWIKIDSPLMFRMAIIDDVPLLDSEVGQQLYYSSIWNGTANQLLDMNSGGALTGRTLYPQQFRVIPATNDSAYEVKRYRIIGIVGNWGPVQLTLGLQLANQFAGISLDNYPTPANLTIADPGTLPLYRCPLALKTRATRTAESAVSLTVTTGWQCIGTTA